MRTRMTIGIVLALALIAMTPGCEDSDVTAPSGSLITLIAAPASVFIDQDGGDTKGTVSLIAQVVDAGGLPLQNIPLFFTTDGGQLGTVNNICLDNTCSRTGTDCTSPAVCAPVAAVPTAVETNGSGVATDTLLLRLIEDPDTVRVTVQGTGLTAEASVTKTVNLGTDPVANIAMSPPGGQLSGEIVLADGTGSTFDPNADPTCYEWKINSNIGPTIIRRGPNLSLLDDLTFGTSGDPASEQTLSISLRVSDKLSIVCEDNVVPDAALFSNFPASVTYVIECDLTAPQNVDAGPDRFESLANSPDDKVSIALSAVGSDPEFPLLDYQWNCGGGVCSNGPSFCTGDPATSCIESAQCVEDNGPCTAQGDCSGDMSVMCASDQDCIDDNGPCTSPSCDGQSVTCTYDVAGSFEARVTVTNKCLLTTVDTLIVNVVQ